MPTSHGIVEGSTQEYTGATCGRRKGYVRQMEKNDGHFALLPHLYHAGQNSFGPVSQLMNLRPRRQPPAPQPTEPVVQAQKPDKPAVCARCNRADGRRSSHRCTGGCGVSCHTSCMSPEERTSAQCGTAWQCANCSRSTPPQLPSLVKVLSSQPTSTLRHVPKSLRNTWSEILMSTLNEILQSPVDMSGWVKLLIVAQCLLAAPPRQGRAHMRDTEKIVKERMRRWKAGEEATLWNDQMSVKRPQGKKSKTTTSESNSHAANVRRAKTAIADGQYKKAMQALTSEGIAEATPALLQEMIGKHPQTEVPQLPTGPVPPPLLLRPQMVARCISTFPNGTAPGPSCLRASHLKEAVECPSADIGQRALQALCDFLQLLINGQTPAKVIPILCGATLIACKKKDGGVRPIAVGEVIRRLASKCVMAGVARDAANLLAPLQVGVGTPLGCEAIVHALRSTLQSDTIPPQEKWTLMVHG